MHFLWVSTNLSKGNVNRSKPYQAPIIIAVLRATLFQPKAPYAVINSLGFQVEFDSKIYYAIPLPLLALVATAVRFPIFFSTLALTTLKIQAAIVHAQFDEDASSKKRIAEFSCDKWKGVYHSHVDALNNITPVARQCLLIHIYELVKCVFLSTIYCSFGSLFSSDGIAAEAADEVVDNIRELMDLDVLPTVV